MRRSRLFIEWLLFVAWALFINAVDSWILGPLAQDYAIQGIAVIFIVVALWLTSIPKRSRKRWIGFTLFGLLVGQGLSDIAPYPIHSRIVLGLLMCIGLCLVVYFFTKIRVTTIVISTLSLVAVNSALPLSEWTFLTHFGVVYYGRLNYDPSDMSSLPLSVVNTGSGQAIVTVNNLKENRVQFELGAQQAVGTADALSTYLHAYRHRYVLMELSERDTHFSLKAAPAAIVSEVNPSQLVGSFFPFTRAYWTVENNQVLQYMSPADTPRNFMLMAMAPADYPANVSNLAVQTDALERSNWQGLLDTLGRAQTTPNLSVQNGVLTGRFEGHDIHVAVRATSVLGAGSFTAPGANEVLLQGVNRLEVVSLDGSGRVVTDYQGSVDRPLVNDIKVGRTGNLNRDDIFVNSSPAFILQASADGNWTTLYTAPNPSFRFEGSVQFASDRTPEIIANDPSLIRNIPTRYFSSYTYQGGQLYRNWRVYHTNVVNVQSVQFERGGPTYLVASMYSTGKFVVLKRHFIPVVPITCALIALVLIAGWVLRFRNRGEVRHV